jgi:Dyp-type peroxidase family
MLIDLDQELNPINPENPKYDRMLANLQGNILKSHGRNLAAHLFLEFTGEPKYVKKWIADFTNRFVTSAFRQLQETREYRLNKISGRTFGAIYLTAAGYQNLGFNLKSFNEARDPSSPETYFRDGMKKGGKLLNDPCPDNWEQGYQGPEIHALLLLADEDHKRLLDIVKRVERSLSGVGKILVREDGIALRDGCNKPVEQFGYHDGISQPLYYKADVKEEKEKFGINRWDPSAPLNIILVKDPLAQKEDSFGSYLVFRKLEQNVRGFKEAEESLAGELGLPSEEENEDEHERAGALVIGRFENGIPVLGSKTADACLSLKDMNNFNYAEDPEGKKCPFAAHIRRVNPRGDTGFSDGKVSEEERRHRITRRGITYGKRELGPDDMPTLEDRPSRNVGLLFMCFQSSIPNQFGFMQARANKPKLAKRKPGLDPVIGQSVHPNNLGQQQWPTHWGGDEKRQFDFGDFVTLKGGEYFFAPSIPFLRSLDGELPAVTSDQAEFQAEGTGANPSTKKKNT